MQESRGTYVAGWRVFITYGRGRRDGEVVRLYTVRDGFIAKPGRVAWGGSDRVMQNWRGPRWPGRAMPADSKRPNSILRPPGVRCPRTVQACRGKR